MTSPSSPARHQTGTDKLLVDVADAVEAGRFWVFPHPEFVELAVRRWHGIAEGSDPEVDVHMPGMSPRAEMLAEVRAALEPPGG